LFRNQFAVSGGCGGDEEEEWEVFCRTVDAVVHCDRYCQNHNVPWFVVGKGSNCLFDDRGFDGCIILNRINFVEVLDSGVYRVGSGHAFNILGMLCSRDGFSGLEFASGIPGTVGGAIFMNAGADGQETADVLQSVEIVTSSGDWCTLSKEREELAYSYRTSPFQKMKHVAAIVAATFQLTPCPNARQRQKLFLDRYLPSTFCYACYRLRNCNSAPDIPCCRTHSRLV
jgi:UDP-N-acetylmuramate dehydrogenase